MPPLPMWRTIRYLSLTMSPGSRLMAGARADDRQDALSRPRCRCRQAAYPAHRIRGGEGSQVEVQLQPQRARVGVGSDCPIVAGYEKLVEREANADVEQRLLLERYRHAGEGADWNVCRFARLARKG